MAVYFAALRRPKALWQGLGIGSFLLAQIPIASPALSQITSANDGVGSVVTQNGQQFDITGGSLSNDGQNAFHSFDQFGLSQGQIANFIANPDVLNILSRVVGGDPSIINGQLTITGAEANLFVVNPAGVFFGENAQLNVPASFTATTATGIGFENGWFNVLDDVNANSYSALVGNPDQFVFKTDSPGTVFNAGALSVAQGQTLSLIGGQAVSVGSLTSDGGEILLAAVPGQSVVTLRPSGNILSLEVNALEGEWARSPDSGTLEALEAWTLPVASLPDVLTGGTLDHASTVTVNPNGTLTLASGQMIATVPAGATVAGAVDVSTPHRAGGTVAIAGGEIGLLEANINANGFTQGGTVQIGGNQQGQGRFPTSDRTYLSSNTTVTADAIAGDGGHVIVYSDGTTGFFGEASASGGSSAGNGGFVELSGRQQLVFDGEVNVGAANGTVGTVLLDPENIVIVAGDRNPEVDGESNFTGTINATDPADDGVTTTLFESDLERIEGNLLLEATNDITVNPLEDGQLNVFFDILFRADADNDNQGDFSMDPSNQIVTNGNDVVIEAANIVLGTINTGFVEGGGDISLLASGNVNGQSLITTTEFGNSGNVVVDADGNVTISRIDTGTSNISSFGTNNGGNVTVNADGNVQIGQPDVFDVPPINTSSFSGAGGSVSLGGDRVSIVGTDNQGASIVTDGQGFLDGDPSNDFGIPANLSGTISITHAGGPDNIDFIVGDTRGTAATGGVLNGTAGSIRTGTTFEDGDPTGGIPTTPTGVDLIVEPTQAFPVITSDPGVLANGSDRVTITSINSAPELTGSVAVETSEETSVLISLSLNPPVATDIDEDNTVLEVASIAEGSVLTLDGEPLAVGDIISEEDQIVYTPAPGLVGEVEVFQVVASDRVSPSLPILINATITEASPTPTPTTPIPSPTPDLSPTPTPSPIPEETPTPDTTPDSDGDPTLVGGENVPSPSPDPSPDNGPDIEVLDPSLPPDLRPAIDAVVANGIEDPIDIPSLPSVEFYTVNTVNTLENSTHLTTLEKSFANDFTDYFGLSELGLANNQESEFTQELEFTGPDSARQLAYDIEEATGERPGFVYISFLPPNLDGSLIIEEYEPQDSDELELVVITARGGMIRRRVPGITRNQVTRLAQEFRRDITLPTRNATRHLTEAHQLYRWLVAPIQDQLENHGITNLSFLADEGLRTLPFAALHDGEHYLVEKYSVGLMPSLSLTNTEYVDVRDASMLAMGVSESTNGQVPLPAVPTELSTLIFDVWKGELFLNESATLDTLQEVRERTPFGIIHMATHARFQEGEYAKSYIQLWNDQLTMDKVRQLGWNDPAVEMLVLSACQTAIGSYEAELGFAGLALQTGVKTAIASLWSVDDTATMSLMAQFYNTLNTAPIKSEALRQAQLALLQGDVAIREGMLFIKGLDQGIPLPEESLTHSATDLSHPYFWSAFTTVGNPW